MPHWEVDLFINGYYKNRAKNLLSLLDIVVIGNGFFDDPEVKTKLVDNLMIQAGYKKPKPKKVTHDWANELIMFATGKV